jgi:hypothetical protein
MPLDSATRIFFDASALFVGANTPEGGSAFLLSVCSRGFLQAVVSPDVLLEVERNVFEKGRQGAVRRFRELIAFTPFLMAEAPTARAIRLYGPRIR